MESLWVRTKTFYEKYEGRIGSVALVFGFVFDSITLQRIDLLFENLVILFYITLSGGGIILINYLVENPPKSNFFKNLYNFLPLFIQFAFGGLFSGFFIFYSRSATLSSSWPFVLILLIILVGNEFFKKQYERLTFQVAIYFAAIFSFFIFFVPVLLKTMGPRVFLLSGLVSLVAIYLFNIILSKVVPASFQKSKKNLKGSVVSIFILINVLYFGNLIPPIPLSLKDAGAYYFVERVGGDYKLEGPEEKWYDFFKRNKLRLGKGDEAYVFSSVFAPTDLNTDIVHDWQYFNEDEDRWISLSKISFPINGGRDGGYRGFSVKSNIFSGKWRVDIKTDRDQIIGRVRFNVDATDVI